jgi:hypothetical protein
MKNLFWVACFSRQRERLKVPNTSHIGYIIGGSQTESKSFAPHHLLHGCETLSLIFHAHPKEFIYFFESFLSFVILAIRDWASLIPPHSRAMTSE